MKGPWRNLYRVIGKTFFVWGFSFLHIKISRCAVTYICPRTREAQLCRGHGNRDGARPPSACGCEATTCSFRLLTAPSPRGLCGSPGPRGSPRTDFSPAGRPSSAAAGGPLCRVSLVTARRDGRCRPPHRTVARSKIWQQSHLMVARATLSDLCSGPARRRPRARAGPRSTEDARKSAGDSGLPQRQTGSSEPAGPVGPSGGPAPPRSTLTPCVDLH